MRRRRAATGVGGEHSWPITFSYALGSFSARKGMRSGLSFSLSFTLQRALLSEIAYLGLLRVADSVSWDAAIYLVVGLVMVQMERAAEPEDVEPVAPVDRGLPPAEARGHGPSGPGGRRRRRWRPSTASSPDGG